VKIIETHQSNDARGTLLGLMVFGIAMPLLGALVIAFDQGPGGEAMRWGGLILAGVGGVLLQLAVIGYGVMLGIRAAKP
jgi:hypothetical protein